MKNDTNINTSVVFQWVSWVFPYMHCTSHASDINALMWYYLSQKQGIRIKDFIDENILIQKEDDMNISLPKDLAYSCIHCTSQICYINVISILSPTSGISHALGRSVHSGMSDDGPFIFILTIFFVYRFVNQTSHECPVSKYLRQIYL